MHFDLLFFDKMFLASVWQRKFVYLSNFHLLPIIARLLLIFSVRNLESLDHPKIFNYIYLLRFFFGKKARIASYESFFKLGKYYFSFDVLTLFNKAPGIHSALFFLVYDLQPFINVSLISNVKFSSIRKIAWVLWDLNIFTEKKTNVGLFDLVDPLSFTFILRNSLSFPLSRCVLQSLKLLI